MYSLNGLYIRMKYRWYYPKRLRFDDWFYDSKRRKLRKFIFSMERGTKNVFAFLGIVVSYIILWAGMYLFFMFAPPSVSVPVLLIIMGISVNSRVHWYIKNHRYRD